MAETIFCSKCGTTNLSNAQNCQKCGISLWPAGTVPAYTAGVPAAMVTGQRYGGFWIRFLAFIIDYFILRLALIPVFVVFGFSMFSGLGRIGPRMNPDDIVAIAHAGLIVFCITAGAQWLYEALLTSSAWQGTIGKRVLNLKVTDEAAQRISFAQATGRHFAKYLSLLLFGIGFIMAAFTERKRALHDMIAGTLVIRS